jgi:tetratricopeptide (TPR) repeat protein
METQENNSRDVLGIVGVVFSLGGAIGTILVKEAAVAIGLGVTIIWWDQKQQLKNLAENNQQSIVNLERLLSSSTEDITSSLTKKGQENYNDLSAQLRQLQESLSANVNTKAQELTQSIQGLEADHKHLKEIVGNLQQIENTSQLLRANPNSAEFYYQRGIGYERLGNKEGAMEDFNEAIKLDGDHAKSYHQRGMIAVEMGEKKRAVDDLRKASLLYFEQGDLENYQKTREMSKSIHDLRTNPIVEGVPLGQVFDSETVS